MKIPRNRLPVLSSGLAVALASAALLSAALPATPSAAAAAQTTVQKTGAVEAWRLDMDGRLYLRLRSLDGAEAAWYVTPPERDPSRNVEEMLLAVLLAAERASVPMPLMVTAKEERAREGKAPDDALPILAVQRP
jgi:hypothetical protein